MLNKSNSVAFSILPLVIIILSCDVCTSSPKLRLPEDDASIATLLASKGYRINGYKWKPGRKIESIEFNKKTQYTTGDFESLCSIKSIKHFRFEDILMPKLTQNEVASCSKNSDLKLDFVDVELELDSLCLLADKIQDGSPAFYFSNTNVNDHTIDCISKISRLKSIYISRKSKISEDSICKLTLKVTSVTFFGLNNVPFSKKALDCIFSLPKLTRVTLQNWSKVPDMERIEYVRQYEIRHGRKIESIIADPTTDTY
ncbi:hypothetical protein JWG40_10055 [Leptospira sp. 201903074]|uniref:hypothetical protein n=1 Tax=Leptospira abararensis TaxID=2810036 RepID=UPI0019628F90|nr:hypothetical protein [Leptospira abararensis]MBM9547360.1 hypothetical protein [Leptospira abararensis]